MRTLADAVTPTPTNVVSWLKSSKAELTTFAWGLTEVELHSMDQTTNRLTDEQLEAIQDVYNAVANAREVLEKAIENTDWTG
jgi:hypothetical protein